MMTDSKSNDAVPREDDRTTDPGWQRRRNEYLNALSAAVKDQNELNADSS
jgi:hypothetical protein